MKVRVFASALAPLLFSAVLVPSLSLPVSVTRSSSSGSVRWHALSGFEAGRVSSGSQTNSSTDSREFSRITDSSGSKVETWSTCSPVSWYLQKEMAPRWSLRLLKKNFKLLSSLTGVSFVYGGPVSGVSEPGFSPPPGLSVAFVKSGSLSPSGSSSKVAGLTRLWLSKTEADVSRISSAVVIYDLSAGAYLSRTARKSGKQPSSRMWQPLLLHELGHAVGLGHIDSKRELMYPSLRASLMSFQKGDLAGLADIKRSAALLDAC